MRNNISVQDTMQRRYAEARRYARRYHAGDDEQMTQYWRGYANGMRFVLEAHRLWDRSLERMALGYDLGEDPGEQLTPTDDREDRP